MVLNAKRGTEALRQISQLDQKRKSAGPAAYARDYSFSIRRDLTSFSPNFCLGVTGFSDE